MKKMSFSTVSVIALTGLFLTLASNLSAADRTVDKLPADARAVRYNGERCWFAGGQYYRPVSAGVYLVIAKPMVEEDDEEGVDATVTFLPEDSTTVTVAGERCWYHDGTYYRQCGRAYKKMKVTHHPHSTARKVRR